MGIVSTNDRRGDWKKDSGRHDGQLGQPANNMAFDSWLVHHLARLYDPVVRDPLPADLIRLLDRKEMTGGRGR